MRTSRQLSPFVLKNSFSCDILLSLFVWKVWGFLYMKKYADIFILFSGILWGLVGPIAKTLRNAGFTSVEVSALRWIFSGIIMVLMVFIFNRSLLKIHFRNIWWFLCTGILCILFSSTLYFVTMPLATVAVANILMYTSPVWVLIFSILLFKEKITLTKMLALVLAFVGCIFVTGAVSPGGFSLTPLGLATGLCSGLFYGLYSIFGKFVLKKYDSITVTLYTVVFAAIGSLPLINFFKVTEIISANPSSILSFIALVLLMTIAPYTLYTLALKLTSATRASIISCIEPMTSAIIGTIILNEPFGVFQMLGAVLILASGIVLQIKSRFKN